jgi:predicted RNase H-like HicB family nuclease
MATATTRAKRPTPKVTFSLQVWKEEGVYVAYAPELDVSSCGDSVREARKRLRDAVALFLEEAAHQGTLKEILSESGFEKRGDTYHPRRVLVRETELLAVPGA